jgi:hypothetical protein
MSFCIRSNLTHSVLYCMKHTVYSRRFVVVALGYKDKNRKSETTDSSAAANSWLQSCGSLARNRDATNDQKHEEESGAVKTWTILAHPGNTG